MDTCPTTSEEWKAFYAEVAKRREQFRLMPRLDINSLDPLERQGDDSRDFQRDYEDERREGWAYHD